LGRERAEFATETQSSSRWPHGNSTVGPQLILVLTIATTKQQEHHNSRLSTGQGCSMSTCPQYFKQNLYSPL
jgi:hypothetical protein